MIFFHKNVLLFEEYIQTKYEFSGLKKNNILIKYIAPREKSPKLKLPTWIALKQRK